MDPSMCDCHHAWWRHDDDGCLAVCEATGKDCWCTAPPPPDLELQACSSGQTVVGYKM